MAQSGCGRTWLEALHCFCMHMTAPYSLTHVNDDEDEDEDEEDEDDSADDK